MFSFVKTTLPFLCGSLILPLLVAGASIPSHSATFDPPTVEEAAVSARELVFRETIGTLSSVYPDDFARKEVRGVPIGLMEYYADCSSDGSPTMLAMNVATSFRNAANGAPVTLSLRETPTGEGYHPIARPRLALMGKVVNITIPEEQQRVQACYVARHPEAKWWMPGTGFHGTYWVKLQVESVYWVGGFGNVAYVGFIPPAVYHSVSLDAIHSNPETDSLEL